MKTWYFKLSNGLHDAGMGLHYDNVEYLERDAETFVEAKQMVEKYAKEKLGEPISSSKICYNGDDIIMSWHITPMTKYYYDLEKRMYENKK